MDGLEIPSQNNKPAKQSPVVHFMLCGREGDRYFSHKVNYTILREAFNPHVRWELKDCVGLQMHIPQKFMYSVVEEIIDKDPFFVLVIRPESQMSPW
jgi:hypothetical protein